jgi:hypothetical protein
MRLHMSDRLAKTVFLVPSRISCGGIIVYLRRSVAMSGLFFWIR